MSRELKSCELTSYWLKSYWLNCFGLKCCARGGMRHRCLGRVRWFGHAQLRTYRQEWKIGKTWRWVLVRT